jgi:hypothetical protein
MFIRKGLRLEYAIALRRLPSARPARTTFGALHEPGAGSIQREFSTCGGGPTQGAMVW